MVEISPLRSYIGIKFFEMLYFLPKYVWTFEFLNFGLRTFYNFFHVCKNVSRIFVVFAISRLIQNQNLTILVPIPHKTQGIMWGRDKIFKVSMLYELRFCGKKNMQESFLFFHPLDIKIQSSATLLFEYHRLNYLL